MLELLLMRQMVNSPVCGQLLPVDSKAWHTMWLMNQQHRLLMSYVEQLAQHATAKLLHCPTIREEQQASV